MILKLLSVFFLFFSQGIASAQSIEAMMNNGAPAGLAIAIRDLPVEARYSDVDLFQVEAPTVATAALAGAGAGNVDNGVHKYKVTFVTALGETELGYHIPEASVTVSNKNVNGKVSLTNIDTAPNQYHVTARKIYRTVAAGSVFKLLTTLSNNTTTTYTDNIADASLGSDDATFRPNTTLAFFANTSLGRRRIAGYIGVQNTCFGVDCLSDVTTGYWNVSIGEGTFADITTGHENAAFGLDSQNKATTGHTNTSGGIDSLYNNTTGFGNTALGAYSLIGLVGGNSNIGIGKSAGANQTAGDNNIIIGTALDTDNLTGSDQLNLGGILKANLSSLTSNFTGKFGSTVTADIGWTRVNGANTACNTTCTYGCVFGWDAAAPGALLACTDATADSCLCAGPS